MDGRRRLHPDEMPGAMMQGIQVRDDRRICRAIATVTCRPHPAAVLRMALPIPMAVRRPVATTMTTGVMRMNGSSG